MTTEHQKVSARRAQWQHMVGKWRLSGPAKGREQWMCNRWRRWVAL